MIVLAVWDCGCCPAVEALVFNPDPFTPPGSLAEAAACTVAVCFTRDDPAQAACQSCGPGVCAHVSAAVAADTTEQAAAAERGR